MARISNITIKQEPEHYTLTIRKTIDEPVGAIQYCYLNDTERPPAQYLTQMSLPIK